VEKLKEHRKNLTNEKGNVMKHFCSIDLFVMIMMKWRNNFGLICNATSVVEGMKVFQYQACKIIQQTNKTF